jgi:hypothetical protein
MFNSARQKVGIGLAAGLVIASAVGITSMTSATEPPPTYLTISLELQGRTGTVTFQPLVGPPLVQTIVTGDPCAKIATTGADLLDFTPGGTNTSVQLPRGGLGVESGTNCGNNAAFVSDGQSLTVGLGSEFATATGFSTSIVSADLKILTNADAKLKATYQGTSGPAVAPPTNPGSLVFPARVGETFPPFTDIKLEPQGGSPKSRTGVSLLGAEFTIEIPEGSAELECGDELAVSGTSGDIADTATFTRVGAEEDFDECGEPIGVIVKIADGYVFWDNNKGPDSTQFVQGLFEIAWSPIPSADADRLQTFINYQGSLDGPRFPVQWCESFDEASETGVLPEGPIDEVNGVVIEGTVPWCLVGNVEVLDDDGFILQTQKFYGAGDPTTFK